MTGRFTRLAELSVRGANVQEGEIVLVQAEIGLEEHARANAVISSKVKDHTLLAADFKPGQLPPRGIQGYEVVSPPPNIVMNDIHNSIFMTCPAGKRAIGGGGATGGGIVPGDGPYITSNLPSVDGTGWLVDTTRAVSGYSALVGRIICADVP